jgi:branched-chain amino acid transport system permease protein
MVNKYKALLAVGGSVALSILPLVFGSDAYIMGVLTLCLIWSIVAASWDLIVGYADVFAFGHLAFFVIGGYTSALLAVYLGVSPLVGMLIGGIVCTLLSVLIGITCLGLQGMYMGMVTFSIQFVLPTVIVWAGPGRFEGFSTGGTFGLHRIPPLQVLGQAFSKSELVPAYYLALVFFVTFVSGIYGVIRSRVGLAFVAIRDAEDLARSAGVDERKYKLMAFGISAWMAGVAGGFYAHYYGTISTALLSLDQFLLVFMMVLLGGLGAFPGAVVGAFVITILNELLRPALLWRYIILGAIVIMTMISIPDGLMGVPGAVRGFLRVLRRRSLSHREVSYD